MSTTRLLTPASLVALATLFAGCQSIDPSHGPIFASVTLIVDS